MPEKTCSTCQCNKVCDHNKYGFENCGNYISGDVAPMAEVEGWICRCREWHGVAELKSQRILELESELSKVKAEIAEEIFAEIEEMLNLLKIYNPYDSMLNVVGQNLVELKKKYTEEGK